MRKYGETNLEYYNKGLVIVGFFMLFIMTVMYAGFILLILTVLPETHNVATQYQLKDVWIPGELFQLKDFLNANWFFIPLPIIVIFILNTLFKNKSYPILINSILCFLMLTLNISLIVMFLYIPMTELAK